MNAVIYARYSSDNQREESIEGQLRECLEYANKNNLTVVGEYIDRALSAKTANRPQFQQMITDSNTRKFEIILVWKLDRFSRDKYDSAHYKHLLKKNNVKVVSATERISDSPEGILLESLLEGIAEYYSADLSEKVTRGHTENALKQKFNGGVVPMGFRINTEQCYEIDPDTAPIVRGIFQRYADGESITKICSDLNERGIRTPKGKLFTQNSFQTLLKNRKYLGEYSYNGIVHIGAIPAIISEDLFAQVQLRRKKNKSAPSRTKTDVNFILTTKLFCGKCGAMMAGESGTSKTGNTYYYYKCGNHKRNGKDACDLKAIRKEQLEAFVIKVAIEKCLTDECIQKLTDKLLKYQSGENTRIPVLQAELKAVQKRIDNIITAIENGVFTPSVQQRLTELEERQNALKVSIVQEQIRKPAVTKEQIEFFFSRFKNDSLQNEQLHQQIVDCFINSIYVFEDKIVVNFNCTNDDGTVVTLKEVKSSIENCSGAPERKPPDRVSVWRFFVYRKPLARRVVRKRLVPMNKTKELPLRKIELRSGSCKLKQREDIR